MEEYLMGIGEGGRRERNENRRTEERETKEEKHLTGPKTGFSPRSRKRGGDRREGKSGFDGQGIEGDGYGE